MQPPHLRQPPGHVTLPAPIWFRVEAMPDNGTYPFMRHPWGEFVYSYSGVTELRTGGQVLLAPPHMAFWIPAGADQVGYNRKATVHVSIYIDQSLCAEMPDVPVSLRVTPLLRAMLDRLELASFDDTAQQARLLRVMVDEMERCPVTQSFLPDSDEPALKRLLAALHDTPSDRRSTATLARSFGLSERTLLRLCKRDLGMSLTEWRNRQRAVRAIAMLQEDVSVETIALDLGYATASAFIAMFKGIMGDSPARYVGR
ncbi:helix-turn-helix transcriptional regulator [Gemmobacter sp. 24YEA27]|uniref:AraC family transcriptional regulator n=1 Tax=Gemmobacter sp. 24YEA27 TaxID=3040672 RepID=UPI0024B3A493|nr:helix-turn-helix transcriptional regulator [Gemmobacter sp. 24YEA27]